MKDLPELYRYAATEASASRLWAGGISINVVCFCMYLLTTRSSESGTSLFYGVLGLQALILLIYGAQRAAASVSRERAERTWDFQRITPLSSGEFAAGKLLGAPLYAYFLAASALPWLIPAVSSGPPAERILSAYGMLAGLSFLTLCLCLLASAYTTGASAGSVNTGGALLGFFGLQTIPMILTAVGKEISVSFYGLKIPWDLFFMATTLFFGAWSFAAAKWRIGKDLLEEGRVWRLPAFMIALALYIYGLLGEDRILTGNAALTVLAAPAFFAYAGGFLHSERLEHWRAWLKKPSPDRTPVWLSAWATLLVIGAGLALARGPWVSRRYIVVILAFSGRDLAFLQWCRFGESRRPETMAASYLALLYCLPAMVLAAFHQPPESFYGPGPGVVQLLAAAALAASRI